MRLLPRHGQCVEQASQSRRQQSRRNSNVSGRFHNSNPAPATTDSKLSDVKNEIEKQGRRLDLLLQAVKVMHEKETGQNEKGHVKVESTAGSCPL